MHTYVFIRTYNVYVYLYYGSMVPFAQFKTREKHPWRNDTLDEACNFTKSITPPKVFFTFFKLYKWYEITQRIT